MTSLHHSSQARRLRCPGTPFDSWEVVCSAGCNPDLIVGQAIEVVMGPDQQISRERCAIADSRNHMKAIESCRTLAVLASPPQATSNNRRTILSKPTPLRPHMTGCGLSPKLVCVHKPHGIIDPEISESLHISRSCPTNSQPFHLRSSATANQGLYEQPQGHTHTTPDRAATQATTWVEPYGSRSYRCAGMCCSRKEPCSETIGDLRYWSSSVSWPLDRQMHVRTMPTGGGKRYNLDHVVTTWRY